MRFITKTNWIITLVVLAVGALAVGTASSVSSCCGRPDPAPVIEPLTYAAPAPAPVAFAPAPVIISAPVAVSRPSCSTCAAPVTISAPCSTCSVSKPACSACSVQRPAYKLVRETEMREEEITTYETVWDEETRYRTRTVCKRVPETSVRRETVRVSKPVWETIEKETSYDVVRYVSETSEREEVSTVCKPVTEYQEKEIVETVNRPVQETVMQQRTHQVNRPVTTCETRTRECGEYETRYVEQPGREYTRLTWQKGGDYYDPETGRTRYRLPGLYWTDLHTDSTCKAERVYRPRTITETVPVTRMVPETVVEEVPVTVNKVVQEQVVRKEQVPVTRMVQEQVVRKIPVTSYKPVTEKVVKKTPVKVCRMETVDEVREVPVTTYKMVTETIKEPYTVKIARQVPKVVKVQRPVSVCRRVPIDACGNEIVQSETVSEANPSIKEESLPSPADSSEAAEAVPADKTPALSEGESSETVTSKYPSADADDSKVITTDAPAVPDADAIEQKSSKPALPGPAPAIVRPSAADQAPPMSEADKTPVIETTPNSAPSSAPSADAAPQTEEPAKIAVSDSIESKLVPSEDQGSFRFVADRTDYSGQRQNIPSNAPTRLLKY